jgi:hypothetical protein
MPSGSVPRRAQLLRYSGVFAPGSRLRALVVPKPATKKLGKPVVEQLAVGDRPAPREPLTRDGTSRIDWASLLKRVYAVDILACPCCGGRLKVLAVIEQTDVVAKILGHIGMPTVYRFGLCAADRLALAS